MSKRVIKSDNAPVPVARYSQAIKVGNTLYVQGVIALDPSSGKLVIGDITVQAIRVFESIKSIVEAAGMSLSDVIRVSAFLSNLEDYPKFNEVYNSYFTSEPHPVRTTVQVGLPFGALLEVEVTACD
jgi:2-iminobutanoate/2-iminopropanoate deaminase